MKLFRKIYEKQPLKVYTITLYTTPIIGLLLMLAFSSMGEMFEGGVHKLFTNLESISLLVCFIFYHITWFVNFIYAVKNAVLPSPNGGTTGKGVLVYKLIQAPYHCIFFLFCFIWAVGAYNPFLIWSYIFLPFAAIHSYCILLSTSVYGISRAIRLRKDGVITTGKAVIIIVLLLIFLLDFVGATMLIAADNE